MLVVVVRWIIVVVLAVGGLLVAMAVLVLHVVLEMVGGDCGGGVGCDAGR